MDENNKEHGKVGRPFGFKQGDPRHVFIRTQLDIIRGKKKFPHYDRNGEYSERLPTLDDVQKALQAIAPFVVSKVAASKKVATAVPDTALDTEDEGHQAASDFTLDFDLDAPVAEDSDE